MNRMLIMALVLGFSGHIAHAGEISSAYTEIDFDQRCSIFDSGEDGEEFANLTCDGWRGYPVLVFAGDLRESLFYGFPPEGALPWESFSAFNQTGPKIEWRIETEGTRAAPFATIHRWFVSTDPENSENRTEVLVVSRVGQVEDRKGCVVGLVRATGNPDANVEARRIADERARNFVCGRDQAARIGNVPDFNRSE